MKYSVVSLTLLSSLAIVQEARPTTEPIKGHTLYVSKKRSSDLTGALKQVQQTTPTCKPCSTIPTIQPDSSVPQQNPTPKPGAFFPSPSVSNHFNPPPQTLGITFVGGRQGTNPSLLGTPPDSYGVKGLTQFVVGDNNGFVSFDPTTGRRDNVINAETVSLANLDFDITLLMANGDTRIHYDRLADRYVAVIALYDANSALVFGAFVGYSGVCLAVSDSGILTKNTHWSVLPILDNSMLRDKNGCPVDVTSPVSAGVYSDYPCLGMDAHAVYVSIPKFQTPEPGVNTWVSNTLYVIQKKSLYCPEEEVVITAFPDVIKTLDGNFVGDQSSYRDASTLFPLNNFDDSNPKFGYALCQDPVYWGKLRMYRILNAGSCSPSIVGPFTIDVMQTFVNQSEDRNNSPFPGLLYYPIGLIEGLDDRLADSSHINVKQVYSAHSVLTNKFGIADQLASPSPDRRSIRWYQLDVTGDPTGNGRGCERANTVPALVQAGTLFDMADEAPLYYTFPAIMSNSQGDISLCGTVMGMNQSPSAFYVGKAGTDQKDGTLNIGSVLNQPNVYATGFGSFTRSLSDDKFGQRWGDMSYSSVDPVDKKTIWTIQEICQNGVEVKVVAELLAP